MSDKGTTTAGMSRIKEIADEAQATAAIAADAMAMLTQLIVNNDLDDNDTGRLDVDAYYTFAGGIATLITRIHEQAGQIYHIAHANQ